MKSFDVDCIVIGAGVVGLAVTRAIALKGHSVMLLEKEGHFGTHTSSRNSEVIHAGIYYRSNSLKGKFCLAGRDRLYRYCEKYNIPHRKIGKLIVATDERQFPNLETLQEKSKNLGAGRLDWLTKHELSKLEPELQGKAALFSRMTGIIDSHQYMLSLLALAENNGAQFIANSKVENIQAIAGGYDITVDCGETESFRLRSRAVVNSAGLFAWDVATSLYTQISKDLPDCYLAKGTYYNYSKKPPFSHLIYPVPVDGGLGIHVTLDLGNAMRFGPDVEWIKSIDYSTSENRKPDFLRAIKLYFPRISAEDITASFTGIRPKTAPPGTESDFMINDMAEDGLSNAVHLFGIESPGLTASLAIGEAVAQKIKL